MRAAKRALALGAATVAVLGMGVVSASTAAATIHPIMNGWACGNATGDPPGQTPGENHSNTSTLRALQATGFLTFTQSGPVIDTTVHASKFSTFNPVSETGTGSNPATIRCLGQ